MHPKLMANPLVAWRDETTLQIGWGPAGLVVEAAPACLPAWLARLDGTQSRSDLLAAASLLGIPVDDAEGLLSRLEGSGLVGGQARLTVSVASAGLVRDALADALCQAGVNVVRLGDVVVFPQGQLPSLVAAPQARRLIPVWFAGRAVHVGPVIDEAAGPCPRCIDLAWTDIDPCWPHLVAQAGSLAYWDHPSQIVQAAAAICLLSTSEVTVGLEMILDRGNPGPCWRVWSVHPRCACQRT